MENKFIKEETIKKLLQSHLKEEKTRLSPEALKVFTKFVELFIREGINRSIIQAQNEDLNTVEVEHLEKILPQLLLDF